MVPVHYTWDEIPYPSGPEIQQIDGHLFAYWYKGPQLEGYAIPLKPRPSATQPIAELLTHSTR